MKKLAVVTMLIVALGGFLFAGGQREAEESSESASDEASRSKELVVAVQQNPPVLEVIRVSTNPAMRIAPNIYDTLITFDYDTFELEPGLATSWEREDDRTLLFHLREGVRFHDGTEMTAEDVVFTFGPERFFNEELPGYGNAQMYFGHLESIDAVDDYTVRVTAKDPDPLLELRFASYMSEIISKEAFLAAADYDDWSRNVVGTGAYRLVEMKADEHIRLEAFDDYWGGTPPVDTIEFRVVPEISSRVAGLVSGEYDIITELPPDQFSAVEQHDDLEVAGGPIRNHRVILFREPNPLMQDPLLRRAITLAIDRELIVDTLYDGMTNVPNGNQFTYYNEMYLEDAPALEYDPDAARELLARSSYDGEELVYRLLPGYYTMQLATAEAMQQMWKEVGINVKLEIKENWDQVLQEDTCIQDYSTTMMYPDPVGHYWRLWEPNGVIQRLGFWVPPERFNELGRILASSTDLQERRVAFREMLEIGHEDPWGTVLHQLTMFYGKKRSIPWKATAMEYMDFSPQVYPAE
ncbi:MAG: ABC transporter substrate-binding protein [Alkalispirochaeta sp.]